MHYSLIILMAALILCACKPESKPTTADIIQSQELTEDSLLTLVQYRTFHYFWDGAEPNSGMARERFHTDEPEVDQNVVTTGGSGFGLMAIVVGIERQFITREEGIDRLERIVGFLETADRFHGMWPHWLNGTNGNTIPFGEKDNGGDLVESAFLAAGLLAVRQYLDPQAGVEENLRNRIDALWKRMEWNWYTKGGEKVLYWHWSPNYAWEMNFAIDGYNECLIAYIMAASSPEHAIDPEVYHQGWAEGGNFVTDRAAYGYKLFLKHNYAEEFGGPLFWAHYTHLGLDPRNLSDRYANYWELNRNHTLINRQWCLENPKGYKGYGEDLWGLTASYSIDFYHAHKPGDDDIGVISPTAALSSFPYTPDESMKVLKNLYYNLGDSTWGKYGFYDAFSVDKNWYSKRYLAIDQGPIVVMIENYRSGLIWNLFMSAPEIQEGLKKLEFDF